MRLVLLVNGRRSARNGVLKDGRGEMRILLFKVGGTNSIQLVGFVKELAINKIMKTATLDYNDTKINLRPIKSKTHSFYFSLICHSYLYILRSSRPQRRPQ